MIWTELHASLMTQAFENVLGIPGDGSMAFVRCLTPDVVSALTGDLTFSPKGWSVWRVSDVEDAQLRTITADQAVELREKKEEAILLLVDTDLAGAGMDGIYSAAREIDETTLFTSSLRSAYQSLAKTNRHYVEQAIKKARGFGNRFNVSPWTEFDFLARIAHENCYPGDFLYLLGLWPIKQVDNIDLAFLLDTSRIFVDRLLSTSVAGITPSQRISSLRLLHPSEEQIVELEKFLKLAATKPILSALTDLADRPSLWINALQIESAAKIIQGIELVPWKTRIGRIAKWSGLIDGDGDDAPPVLNLNPDANNTGAYSSLEIRWKSRPDNLAKGAVEYQVSIVTDMDEELASREIIHSGKREEKCRFTNDDFSMLNDDALFNAKLRVSVIGNDQIDAEESDEFTIRFGEPPNHEPVGVAKKVRTFSEGLIELNDRDLVSELASGTKSLSANAKGFIVLRASGKSYQVFRPPLLQDIEAEWIKLSGAIGRWRIKVRTSGTRVAKPEFVPLEDSKLVASSQRSNLWTRITNASRRMAEQFASSSGVGQIYDEKAKGFEVVKEYLLAWLAALEEGEPSLALANTVEVQSMSGRTLGLIVLPSHPLRVAWHVAYDNLVFHTAFEQGASVKDIRDTFSVLDGAMFPAFLPDLSGSDTFVFADTLGFHAIGMVPASDKEPKAAVAMLARALGESETADTTPTVGKQSAQVIGNEILKYIDCHTNSKLLRVHALRPGDGLTIVRSLGHVLKQYQTNHQSESEEENENKGAPAFILELYPSTDQIGVSGRFIAEAREKRRSGTGVLTTEDRWMLESLSLPGGINLPKLRWARKADEEPKTSAHIAIAFDTFESCVVTNTFDRSISQPRPLFAYGLLNFFERDFTASPSPAWDSAVPISMDGEKHPSDRTHTERLIRLQQAIEQCVVLSINPKGAIELKNLSPTLRTTISPEKARNLNKLHAQCDWVITLDRNGGVEYFDSPRDNKDIYDIYVIDTVPEREDLGCLQLVTSTTSLDEVRNLLDRALDQMGLSHSRRNAQFLMEHLKALSGRLAIRLTGQQPATSELIALALCHANCRQANKDDKCWTSLESGFLVPVDDIRDLLPPLSSLEQVGDENALSKTNARPDLIYVSLVPRKGLSFQFVEIKYRLHLGAARNPKVLEGIDKQLKSLRHRWDKWYSETNKPASFCSLRRAKLARVLRFYADKAHRHYLPAEQYQSLVTEIDRMIQRGVDYSFAAANRNDCGWVFCPEYAGAAPLDITPDNRDTQVFLFGPNLLPDWDFRQETLLQLSSSEQNGTAAFAISEQAAPSSSGDSFPQQTIGAAEGDVVKSTDRFAPPFSESLPSNTDATQQAESQTKSRHQGSICLGKDLFDGSEIQWSLTIKGNPHLLIAGLPGMGKTTCLLNLCRQMLESGVKPIIFSYHQDIDERLEDLVAPVRFLDFDGLGFNPLQVIERTSRLAYLDVAGALRDIFTAIYPELGDIQGERIRSAIKDSFIEQGWDNPKASLDKLQEPPFRRFLEILRDKPKLNQGLRTLLVRLEELDDYGFFNHAEASNNLWETEGSVVIRVHTTQNDNLQRAFASLIFYGLYKDMFRRGLQEEITHAIIFDEAHRAAGLRLIPTMAKECRKYGVSLVLASQAVKDFNTALFSAVANYLVLRLTEPDAKSLVRNVASSTQERMLIDKIKQMERFKALYFSEGKKKPSAICLQPLDW